MRAVAAVVAGGLGLVVAFAVPAASEDAAPGPTARWEMNEPPGADVLADWSRLGHVGVIGDVVGRDSYRGAIAHVFPFQGANGQVQRARLDIVPHRSALNPGSKDFRATVRLRTTADYGNVLQKGQSSTAGGYFKLENDGGLLQCLFLSEDGKAYLADNRKRNDGQWHIVTCARQGRNYVMAVDGLVVDWTTASVGSISNSSPISIGGKVSCNQSSVSCDYFAGEIDFARWYVG